MNSATLIGKVVASSGQELFITLEDHLVVELRERGAKWKRPKEGTDPSRRV